MTSLLLVRVQEHYLQFGVILGQRGRLKKRNHRNDAGVVGLYESNLAIMLVNHNVPRAFEVPDKPGY